MSVRKRFHNPGFTLIELLVVIAIIGILFGLTVAAVQKVRESANRTECANHLRQIGLAVHQYHNSHRQLPPAYIRQDWATWAVLILPYLEQGNIYKLWDVQLRYYDQPNRNLAMDPTPRNLPVYFCPARRTASVGLSVATGNTNTTADIPSLPLVYGGEGQLKHRPGGLSDYAACYGNLDDLNGNGALSIGVVTAAMKPDDTPVASENFAKKMFAQPPGTRITGWKSQTTFQSITDGLSNTLLIGEKYVLPSSRWGKEEDRSAYNGLTRISRRMAGSVPGTNRNFPLVADPNDTWASSTPLLRPADQRFGSHHPGVCQFVFCDGTVRPVRNNVSQTTLSRLAERADGQAITEDY